MTRYEAPDERIRHGYIRLTDNHTGGERAHTDPIHHLNKIATCKGRGPLEFALNLAGWLRVALALTHLVETTKARESSRPEQSRPQSPPGLTLTEKSKAQSRRQTEVTEIRSSSSNEQPQAQPSPDITLHGGHEGQRVCQPGNIASKHTNPTTRWVPYLTGARAIAATAHSHNPGVGYHNYGINWAHEGEGYSRGTNSLATCRRPHRQEKYHRHKMELGPQTRIKLPERSGCKPGKNRPTTRLPVLQLSGLRPRTQTTTHP